MASTSAGAAPTELGTERIGKLLKMYAVPGIIAQTAASLYNMVDSIYIGHIPGVGADAISGLAVTFPLMNLSAAMGTLVGVGGMTLISVLLGQKNYDSAKKVLSNVFALNLLIGILFSIVTLSFLDPILYFFGASDRTIFYAREYMSIILWGNVVTHLYFGFNNLIRSSGHPKTAMGLTLFTVISNAILDPILIFGFDMGIKGAAIATVACQLAALLYTFRFFSDKSRLLHFTRPVLQIDRRIAGQCFAIGLGPFLMNAASSVVAMMINQQLGKYGSDMAIGAYGIVNRVTTFFIMILIIDMVNSCSSTCSCMVKASSRVLGCILTYSHLQSPPIYLSLLGQKSNSSKVSQSFHQLSLKLSLDYLYQWFLLCLQKALTTQESHFLAVKGA